LLNTQFVVFDHPKYGLVPCMVAIADIQQGEEVSGEWRMFGLHQAFL
jgi:hypothetical protein